MNDVKHYVSHSSFLQNSCFHHPRKPSVCIQNKLNMVYIVLMVITTVKSVEKRQDLSEGISTIISCCFWIAHLNSRPFIETDFFFFSECSTYKSVTIFRAGTKKGPSFQTEKEDEGTMLTK